MMTTSLNLNVWKTVRRGNYKSAAELRQAMKDSRIAFEVNGADEMFDKVTFPQTQEEMDIVDVSIEELGLDKESSLQDVYNRAFEHGLELCPADLGPELRMQVYMLDNPRPFETHHGYNDQVLVAMEPIDGHLFLVKTGEYSERIEAVPVEHFKHPRGGLKRRFVFVKPRK
jgi:hypothetical protein